MNMDEMTHTSRNGIMVKCEYNVVCTKVQSGYMVKNGRYLARMMEKR
jgi:hypothetical protein